MAAENFPDSPQEMTVVPKSLFIGLEESGFEFDARKFEGLSESDLLLVVSSVQSQRLDLVAKYTGRRDEI